MLIPLFLNQTGLIKQPVFYISAYLESHRDEYYERLLAISRDNDWDGWCAFFLEVIRVQAEENLVHLGLEDTPSPDQPSNGPGNKPRLFKDLNVGVAAEGGFTEL